MQDAHSGPLSLRERVRVRVISSGRRRSARQITLALSRRERGEETLYPPIIFRSAHIEWAVLAFMIFFCILIVGVSEFYLLPGLSAMKGATPPEQHQLIAMSRLLLALVLLILFSGLVLTVRFGRFFMPRPASPRVKTPYVDVWAEAGKRASVEPSDPTDDEDDNQEEGGLGV